MEIAVRIFSGPHLGAEITLPEGTQVIGSGDSCDIILQDNSVALRHACLEIGPEGVRIQPLDGEVLLGDVPLTEDADFPPRMLCFLGLSCFAWERQENAGVDCWHEVAEELSSRQSLKRKIPQDGGGEDDNKIAATEVADDTEVDVIQLSPEEEIVSEKRSFWGHLLGLCLAILCLCGLMITWQAPRPDRAKQQQFLAKTLKEAGFSQLMVRNAEKGIVVEGFLKNDEERGKLVRLVQKVHFPVGISVKVGADRFNAATAAFNSRGIYPEIKEDAKGGILVSGYTKDASVEEWVFNSVQEDIPQFKATRHIRYANDVEAVLAPLLRAEKLEKSTQRRYLSGMLEIVGDFDERQHRALQQALAQTRKELDIPLKVMIRSHQGRESENSSQPLENGQSTIVGNGWSTLSGKHLEGAPSLRNPERTVFSGGTEWSKEPKPVLGGLQVKSVVVTPMPFITLENGERIFEGGLLPTGQTLETVGIHALKLREKDGTVTVYSLKGRP
jgi:type III secretion protein D